VKIQVLASDSDTILTVSPQDTGHKYRAGSSDNKWCRDYSHHISTRHRT